MGCGGTEGHSIISYEKHQQLPKGRKAESSLAGVCRSNRLVMLLLTAQKALLLYITLSVNIG